MFSPTVLIDGVTVTPPGWMWVFALAVRGCKWAEQEVMKLEFDATVKNWFKSQERLKLEEELREYEDKVKELKERLNNKQGTPSTKILWYGVCTNCKSELEAKRIDHYYKMDGEYGKADCPMCKEVVFFFAKDKR